MAIGELLNRKRNGVQRVEIEVGSTTAGTPVLNVKGEIDLHTCPELRVLLQGLMDEGKKHIILQLAEVPYVDSAALGVLVDTQRRLKEKGGEIYLVQVTPFVLRAFEITRLIRIFHTFPSVAEAAIQAEDVKESGSPSA